MSKAQTLELPIFPLGAVLYPDGLLPLRIFEQRYLEMTKTCIRDDAPFGVCLIREGSEVGTPAQPFEFGCTARIAQWDMPHLGLFSLQCRGEQAFRIVERWRERNGLQRASVQLLGSAPAHPLAPAHAPLAALLERIVRQIGADNFPQPVRMDDAHWVARRLCESLPLDGALKMRVLEAHDIDGVLGDLGDLLKRNAVI